MSQNQQEIDSLLNEVSTLADQAVSDIVGESEPKSSKKKPPHAGPSSGPLPVAYSGTPRREDLRRILRIEVPVIVQLADRTMPLADIVNLSTGAILEFDKPFDSDLDLMINNKCIAQGQAVKVGENFGLRIHNIGTIQERIKAMGGK